MAHKIMKGLPKFCPICSGNNADTQSNNDTSNPTTPEIPM